MKDAPRVVLLHALLLLQGSVSFVNMYFTVAIYRCWIYSLKLLDFEAGLTKQATLTFYLVNKIPG